MLGINAKFIITRTWHYNKTNIVPEKKEPGRVPGIATIIITILFSTLHIACNNMWYIHNIVAKQGRHCTTSG